MIKIAILYMEPNYSEQSQTDGPGQLSSPSFPENSHPVNHSTTHRILSAIRYDFDRDMQPMIRTFSKHDIHELMKINLEFFPLKYGDTYYFRLLNNQVAAYIAELEVTVQCDCCALDPHQQETMQVPHHQSCQRQRVREILRHAEEEHLVADKCSKTPKLSQVQNTYFIAQGLDFESAGNLRIRVMIGEISFTVRDSSGYLHYTQWKDYVFGERKSLYIGTLGVLQHFRNKAVAKRLLQTVIELVERTPSLNLIYLHVISFNAAAIRLYKGMGFKELDTIDGFYEIDNKEYQSVALGRFANGGIQRKSWREWLRGLRAQ